MEAPLAPARPPSAAAHDPLHHLVLMLPGLVPQEVDREGVRDDHDDHGDVEGGQGAEEGEPPVVDDALIPQHDVGRVHEAQGADGRADEEREEPDEDDPDGDEPLGAPARDEAPAASPPVASRLEGAPDAEVAAEADAAHVEDGGGAGEDVARDVDVAPRYAQGPVTYGGIK